MSRGGTMSSYKVGDVVYGYVTGIEKYGIFVSIDNNKYTGLIHISEINDRFISNLNDYATIGETIRVRIIGINNEFQFKLSVKDLDYRISKNRSNRIKETVHGFETLREKLPYWIEKKLKEIR